MTTVTHKLVWRSLDDRPCWQEAMCGIAIAPASWWWRHVTCAECLSLGSARYTYVRNRRYEGTQLPEERGAALRDAEMNRRIDAERGK